MAEACGEQHPEDRTRLCQMRGTHGDHLDFAHPTDPWPNVEVQRQVALKKSNGSGRSKKSRKADLVDVASSVAQAKVEAPPLPDPGAQRAPMHHAGAVDTEVAAANRILPVAGTLREEALVVIAQRYPDGLTDTELGEVTEKYRYSMAPRRVELMQQGWVEDSGNRRLTGRNNHSEVVWRLTEQGANDLGLTS